MPAHSVPSRSKNFTPRSHPISKSTGNAPEERTSACSIGGTSDNTSLTAIWLKPQLRHSISINATAPGLSARPAEGVIDVEDIDPRWPACRRVLYFRLCYFWQCAQVPAISTTDIFGAKPDARAAALTPCATRVAGISPTEPQCSQIRNATIEVASWSCAQAR